MGLNPSGGEDFELAPGFFGEMLCTPACNVELNARCWWLCLSSDAKKLLFFFLQQGGSTGCQLQRAFCILSCNLESSTH
jgi:hypothetical protein